MVQLIQVKQNWHLQFIRARICLSSLNVFWVNEFLDFIFLYGIIKTKSLINILTVVFIVLLCQIDGILNV